MRFDDVPTPWRTIMNFLTIVGEFTTYKHCPTNDSSLALGKKKSTLLLLIITFILKPINLGA